MSYSCSAYFNFRQEAWSSVAYGGATRPAVFSLARYAYANDHTYTYIHTHVCVCVCATKSGIVDRVENVPWQRSARVRGQKVLGWKLAPFDVPPPRSSERCQPTPSVSRAPHRNPPLISFASNPPTVCPNPLKFDRPLSLSLSLSLFLL